MARGTNIDAKNTILAWGIDKVQNAKIIGKTNIGVAEEFKNPPHNITVLTQLR